MTNENNSGLHSLFRKWRTDYNLKTFLNSSFSMLITLIFAIYNGTIGFVHSSLWHGSICTYYILLVIIRFVAIISEKRIAKQKTVKTVSVKKLRYRVYRICSVLLLVLNFSLIAPIALLVLQRRPVNMTLVPAIAVAAYSFYRITLASINLVKKKVSDNYIVHLLRTINFVEALLSIMILENTLMMVKNSGEQTSLLPLTAGTGALIWLALMILSIHNLCKNQKPLPENKRRS